jgi:hypothetical protein
LSPDAVAVPTVVPPVEQLVGADDSGPKTFTVIVPVGLSPEARTELIELDEIAVPMTSVEGPVAVTVGEAFPTTVSDIDALQRLVAVLLLVSPGYVAYHQ